MLFLLQKTKPGGCEHASGGRGGRTRSAKPVSLLREAQEGPLDCHHITAKEYENEPTSEFFSEYAGAIDH